MKTRDDIMMTKNQKKMNCPKTVEYLSVSDHLAEFYGHFREFPKIGTRHENFWNKMRTRPSDLKLCQMM